MEMENSTRHLQKARRSAVKAKTFQSCVACTAYTKRCSKSRPCPSCIKSARQCIPVVLSTERQNKTEPLNPPVQNVERPFACQTSIFKINNIKDELLDVTVGIGWIWDMMFQMKRMGFQVETISKYKTTLSARLVSDIGSALSDAKTCAAQMAHSAIRTPSQNKSNIIVPYLDPANVGFKVYMLGPASGSGNRWSIRSNPFQASLEGMHLEEYLARSGTHELLIPLTELDALVMLLVRTVRDDFGAGHDDLYFRVRCGKRGVSAQGLLICQQTRLVFGEGEEIREVSQLNIVCPHFFALPLQAHLNRP